MRQLTRLKRVARLSAGGTPPVDDPTMWSDDGLPWAAIADMTKGTVIHETHRRVSPKGVSNKQLPVGQVGTVLFAMYASVGAVSILGVESSWNQAIVGVEPINDAADARFIRYWLEHLRPGLVALARSNTQDNLNAEQVGNLPFPILNPAAQRAIADYLDRETARIDSLMSAKRKMSALIVERWQSVMHDAVSGKLADKRTQHRETTIQWLDSVPCHWREGKLKRAAKLGSGHTPSRARDELWMDSRIPWITTGDVAVMRSDRIEYIHQTRECISELGLANSAAELHPAGTVVLCRTASAGFSAIMGQEMATSQDFATWTCGPLLLPRFLLLCLRVMRQDLLGRLAMGSTHKTIYMPDIESIRVPLPPVAEQESLVDAAYGRHQALVAAGDRLQAQISLLEERRKGMIAAAVTGELEIPGAA